MHFRKNHFEMNTKSYLITIALLLAAHTAYASSVIGTVYLKNGTTVECKDADRIKLPKNRSSLKILRNAYGKNRKTETYKFDETDSIVCCHPRQPERKHKIVPTKSGWCRVYFETPYITVYIFSQKGYFISANGGIEDIQTRGSLSQSEVCCFLMKRGTDEPYYAGGMNRNPKDSFRERICRYIEDDPSTEEMIRQSSAIRSKTLLMLQHYKPQK